MAVVYATLAQFTALMKAIPVRMIIAAESGLLRSTSAGIAVMRRRTRDAPPAWYADTKQWGAYTTGNYLRSWQSASLPGVGTGMGAVIYNSAPYAAVIESGQQPAGAEPYDQPSLSRLAKWAIIRLDVDPADAFRVAQNVRRAIKDRGLMPRRVMDSGLDEVADRALAAVVVEIDREIALL